MKYCSVVPKEIVQGGNFHNHPIGTGPFKFQLWVNGVKLILRKIITILNHIMEKNYHF